MVLCSGNPVMMPWLKDVPAIIQTWYGGSAAGDAIADVLSGKVNPSGKLPMTYGVKLEDYGAHSFGSICYPGDSINVEYKEDVLVGYRWFDTKKIKPQFPFGFGLSYTTFEYGKPTVSTKTMSAGGNIIVRVPVKNVGSVEGKETVQLYIGDVKCSVTRPLKELKGFEKISLAPGEEKVVSFTITDDMLKFYSDRKHDWVFESGAFKAYIGSSSRDIKCTIPFTLK
jgi:beta-glucosidase